MADSYSVLNPMTGKLEWKPQPDEYDHHQDVARSAFGDMLHDEERNHKYHAALCEAIDVVRARGVKVKVLDLGTGSGILAMMAAKRGADVVYACEAFETVALCAEQVIKDNLLGDKIHVIRKMSTTIEVGPGKDMEERANILVTEVFDTELIGEGAIETFTHALKELLEPACVVVPHCATVYAQVVHSPFLRSHHMPSSICMTPALQIQVPHSVQTCAGTSAVHDIQLNQLQESDFVPITEPLPMFRFDFTDAKTMPYEDFTVCPTKATNCGTGHAVLMWWALDMNRSGSIHLTCAPYWVHPSGKSAPWRDHWMQGVYYPPIAVDVDRGQELFLAGCRDRYSMWFSTSLSDCTEAPAVPECLCSLHVALSRSRIGMLNDESRNVKYTAALRKVINPESVCLYIGSLSMLPLMALKLGAKTVYVMESDERMRSVLEEYASVNQINGIQFVSGKHGKEDCAEKANLLLSEPFFITSLLPWHNLQFWFQRFSHSHLLTPDANTIPRTCALYGVAVEFHDLWKINAPVGGTEGFTLHAFDSLIQGSQSISDDPVEPHPLWEYPCTALTDKFRIMYTHLQVKSEESLLFSGSTSFESPGLCNGVVLWTDFGLDGDNVVTAGPTKTIVPGKTITWDRFSRQGVQFFSPGQQNATKLLWELCFDLGAGSMTYDFKFETRDQKA
uniref:Protein arginine N-methyltransferase n=1 Tax=Amblyomma aureolatum TaxID=187763 RepID=A0A1E1X2Q1_9ACAR